jgi:hypothetical protein
MPIWYEPSPSHSPRRTWLGNAGAVLAAGKRPRARIGRPAGLLTQITALHIQELLPHHFKGLQPDYYLKNGSKQPIWRFFRAANAVGGLLKTLKLCEFMYLAKFTEKFVIYLTKNGVFTAKF